MNLNAVLLLFIGLLIYTSPALCGDLLPGFVEVEMATELDPTDFALATDGRIFIVEKKGTIRLIRDGKLLDAPFMELEVDNQNERGLMSIVLDPDFENNNYFYLFYSVPVRNFNRVSRFTANGDLVLPGSEMVLYDMDATIGTIHNGGGMIISQDNKLIFAAGDGNASFRPQWDWQTHGKVMRINLDGSFPDDNPKSFGGHKYEAVIARGLRNPFGMTQAEDGTIYINDVGGTQFEEINRLEFEANYGWPIVEGKLTTQAPPPNYMDPEFAYDHDFGCAIVGGVFVPSDHPTYPDELKGKYLFSDYCKGFIQVFDPITKAITMEFATGIDRPLRMRFDTEGNLYYLERAGLGGGGIGDNTQSTEGRLMKIVFTGNGKPVISRDPKSVLLSVGETARFITQANGADPLNYQWFVDGSEAQNGPNNALEVANVQVSQNGIEVYCIVSNMDGRDTSQKAELMVTNNTRPTPMIQLNSSEKYRAGQNISVTGFASDLEDGNLDGSNMVWQVDFHHDLHTHPAVGATPNIDQLNFPVPASGEIDDNVWFRVHLTATDSEGLSASTFIDVFPEKTSFTVESNPTGLEVNVDGQILPTPAEIASVVGIERVIAASPFIFGENEAYLFQNWDNGSAELNQYFTAGVQRQTFNAQYQILNYGTGTGLIGDYYDMENDVWEFPDEATFTRLDEDIDFTWHVTPDSMRLGVDKWLVRWQGKIEPLVSAPHAFGFNARSGVRIFVDNQQMLETWEDRATQFYESDSIYLQQGEKYDVVIEWFTNGSVGAAQFYWATPYHEMVLVRTSQLYPQRVSTIDSNAEFSATVRPNPFRENPTLIIQDGTGELGYEIYNQMGQIVLKKEIRTISSQVSVPLSTNELPAGTYFLKVFNSRDESEILKMVKF